MKIDYEDLFKSKLHSGINLFTGAGFSILPDETGSKLPVAEDLCQEICDKFDIPTIFGSDLETISSIAESTSSQLYQQFLRERFHVEKYNPLYDAINKINLKSYITTNIDNLIQCVIDNSTTHYLRSAIQYGASKKAPNEVQYIPLHGDVNDIESHLYFGKFDLAVVDQYNHNLFELMYSMTKFYPTLFWGYGFHDDGVKKVVAQILPEKRQDIWVLCHENGKMSELFRALGCHIIIGSTQELLEWINENFINENALLPEHEIPLSLKNYFIPNENNVAIIPREDYYLNSHTNWYNVILNHTFDRKELSDIENLSIINKNVIIEGIPLSGKTSMLMQLALKIDTPNKLFCYDLTKEFANFIIQNTKHLKICTIFVDECPDDMQAYALLAATPNIKTIATADSFAFESSKHLLSEIKYKKIEIGELTQAEAQGIYDKIPDIIRTNAFSYKDTQDERFGMLEMMAKNVKGILSEEKVYKILSKAHKLNYAVFEIIAVTAYLTSNKSLASVDIFMSYFDETYSNVIAYIKQAQELLSDITLETDEFDSNYYVLRSHLFAVNANNVLLNKFRENYAKIIRKFIKNTNSFRIYNHYVFRRSAYDANFFYKLYEDNADDLYQSIYQYDGNAYTLQQWALYLLKIKNYLGAFSKIDDAITLKPHNFSIQNTHAIILFEANKSIHTAAANTELAHAMKILAECYSSDKRKVYHAQKFAEFSLFLYREWSDDSYLITAQEWINHIIETDESRTKYTLFLQKQLNNCAHITQSTFPDNTKL